MVITTLLLKSGEVVRVNWKITPKKLKQPEGLFKYGNINSWVSSYVECHRGLELDGYSQKEG